MTQYKACPRCGKIHPSGYKCRVGVSSLDCRTGEERRQRSTKAWTRKSQEVREKAQGLCEVCRDNGAYTYRGLEVHHISKLRDRPDLALDDYNLICLCQEHHKQAEAGKVGKDYLRELARRREDLGYA